MGSPSAGASSTEMEQRFALTADAPLIIPHAGGELLHYCFDYEGLRLGDVEIFHSIAQQRFIWHRFYPFCPHLTPTELRNRWSYLVDANASSEEINRLCCECCDTNAKHPGLEGRGLGTLAHLLVMRNLCQRVFHVPQYTASYFAADSVDTLRLKKSLERAGIADMVHRPVPLQEIHDKLMNCAQMVFGFSLDSSHPSRQPVENPVD